MIDDAPVHDWHLLDQAGLRFWAAQYVGWATNEMSPPEELSWTLETDLSLVLFNQLPTDWESYYRDEIENVSRYDADFINLEYHTPIVISIEEGEPIIWDGWHRIACAIHRGDDRIMAIVGRRAP